MLVSLLSTPSTANYIDSTKLVVCHNRRIRRNKVFKGLAARGKSSMGWFYGFKLHLIVNEHGEIISFFITPGNVPDNNIETVIKLARKMNLLMQMLLLLHLAVLGILPLPNQIK
jgi:hypothetical protein